MIEDKLLRGLATQALNMAKTELRYRGKLHGLLATYFEGEGLRRMRSVEQLIVEKAGAGWLNSGNVKDRVFGMLTAGVNNTIPPDAIVIVTAGDRFATTPAFEALPEDEQRRIMDLKRERELPQYFKPHDVLMSVAQTADRVCLIWYRLQGCLLIGEPEIVYFPQAEFEGRLKLYGVATPPEVQHAIDELRKKGAT